LDSYNKKRDKRRGQEQQEIPAKTRKIALESRDA
jgi:hypothetical protein